MKNKKIIIIIVILAIVALAVYLIFKPREKSSVIPQEKMTQEEKQLETNTQEMTQKWGNFNDNTSNEYLDSLKPYMSDDLFSQYQDFAEAQSKFNDQAGKKLEQKYTINKTELVEHNFEDGESLVYKISATREIDGQQSASITYISYQKIDGEWKIIAIESD